MAPGHLHLFAVLLLPLVVFGNLPPSRPIVGESMGINIHWRGTPPPGALEQLASTGVKWIRMDFSWDAVEQKRGVYNFTSYDELTAALKANNLNAIYILDYSNPLYDNGLSPNSTEGRTAFAAWAVASMKHFSGSGVDILWEMYNEPNGGFWKPKPNVTAYVELALTVGRAIRQHIPQATFIGPATAGVDFEFLTACFQAGLLEYWDAVSVHPYRDVAPETSTTDIHQLRALITKFKPAGVPVIASEWGYSALYPQFDESRQAKVLPRMWMNNMANNIILSIWYDWMNDGTNYTYDEDHFGLVHHVFHEGRTPPYDPKAGFHAATTFNSQLRRKVAQREPKNARFQWCVDALLSYGADSAIYGMYFSPSSLKHSPTTTVRSPVDSVHLSPHDTLVLWCADMTKIPCLAQVSVEQGLCFDVTDFVGYSLPLLCAQGQTISIALSTAPIYLQIASSNIE